MGSNRNDLWSSVDHRQRAKAGEGVVSAPVNNEGEDMFERAGRIE